MYSVVVPVFNHASYLQAAVASALRSSLVSEVILVDDGSNDGSAAVVECLTAGGRGRVRNLTGSAGENRGAAARLNELVSSAREDWVAILDSDDVCVAGRFDVVRAQCRHVGADFVCGDLLIMDEQGRTTGSKRGVDQPEYPFPSGLEASDRVREGDWSPVLANQNFVATTSNMIFKRSLFDAIGGFRDYRYVHDWDFALRASAEGRCLYLPHYLTLYRMHGRNTIRAERPLVAREVGSLVEHFRRDYPQVCAREDVALGLATNRYLQAGGRG